MTYTVKLFTNRDENYIKICETTSLGDARKTALVLCDLLGKEGVKVTQKLSNGSEVVVEGASIFKDNRSIEVMFNNQYGEVITYNVISQEGRK